MKVDIQVTNKTTLLLALGKAPKLLEQGLARAVNDAARRLRTRAVKAITGKRTLAAAYVRDRIKLVPATAQRPVAIVSSRRRATQLLRFKNVQRRKKGKTVPRKPAGIAVKPKVGGQYALLRHAFYVKLRRGTAEEGNFGIAERIGKGRRFEVLYNASVRDLYEDSLSDGLLADTREYLTNRMAAETERALKRVKSS
jgi:hypothetical protein